VICIDLAEFFHQFVAVEIEKIGSLNMFKSLDFGVSHPWTTKKSDFDEAPVECIKLHELGATRHI